MRAVLTSGRRYYRDSTPRAIQRDRSKRLLTAPPPEQVQDRLRELILTAIRAGLGLVGVVLCLGRPQFQREAACRRMTIITMGLRSSNPVRNRPMAYLVRSDGGASCTDTG